VRIGGVCAYVGSGTIIACYNTGNVVSDTEYCAGIVGRIGYNATSVISISACYNVGTITSTQAAAGKTGAIGARANGAVTAAGLYYKNDCTTGTSIIGTSGSQIVFSSENWPKPEDLNWGIGNGTGGNYWKSVGNWNEGTPTYPTLYWE
jgi:hypothetical protein